MSGSNGNGYSHEPPADTITLAPQSAEIEEALLGAIIGDGNLLLDVIGLIRPDDFYVIKNRWIWEAMLKIHANRDTVNVMLLSDVLEKNGRLAEIGNSFLINLTIKYPYVLDIVGYAKKLEEYGTRRRLLKALAEAARLIHSGDTPTQEVVSGTQQLIQEASRREGVVEFKQAPQLVSEHYDQITANARGQGHGIKTYLKDFDTMLGGQIDNGSLFGVFGRPGMCKTSLLLSILRENVKRGVPVGLCSLEMGDFEVTNRLFAMETNIPYTTIKSGHLEDDEWKRYFVAQTEMATWPKIIDTTARITPDQLRNKARQWVWEFGIELLMVDFLQLMSGGARFAKGDNRVREIGHAARECKLIAKEFGIVVMIAGQLNRQVEQRSDKRAGLPDIRDSGEVEEAIDQGLFPYRDEYYNPASARKGIVELNLAKNRNGATGMIESIFLHSSMRVADAVKQHVNLNDDPGDSHWTERF